MKNIRNAGIFEVTGNYQSRD